MKMRKFLTLLLAVMMMASFVPATATAATFKDTSDEVIETISALGLMNGYDDGTFLPDNTLTRGEFAQIIANIYNSGDESDKEWKETFFRDKEEELDFVETLEEEKAFFADVDSAHWAYSAVMTVYSLGLMNGVGDNEFASDSLITTDQVYKVMTLLLCFEEIENGNINYDEKITISENSASMGGSQVFLEKDW